MSENLTPLITLENPNIPASTAKIAGRISKLKGVTKETILADLDELGFNASEVAYHLGKTEEELKDDSYQFPPYISSTDIAVKIRAVNTQHIGAGAYRTRLNGHNYTIGARVTVQVHPDTTSGWHETQLWDTTVDAIVWKIEGDTVYLRPVISYNAKERNLMSREEWNIRRNALGGNFITIRHTAFRTRFNGNEVTVLDVVEPAAHTKPTNDEFINAQFTASYMVDNRISPLDWARLHALNGWVPNNSLYVTD